jgi:hypothetical protein
MILLYPQVLFAAVVVSRKRVTSSRGGWEWFGAWTLAGGLMTFSFLTGFSIGLFVLPLAAGTVLWVASQAPGAFDAIGFVEGIGMTLLLVTLVNPDAGPTWFYAGVVLGLGAIAAYRGVAPASGARS